MSFLLVLIVAFVEVRSAASDADGSLLPDPQKSVILYPSNFNFET